MKTPNKKQIIVSLLTLFLIGIIIFPTISIATPTGITLGKSRITGIFTPTISISQNNIISKVVQLFQSAPFIRDNYINKNYNTVLANDGTNKEQNIEEVPYLVYEVPIYNLNISIKTQRDIWDLCEENNLSYELVLAILEIDINNNIQIDNVNSEINMLSYLRNYWSEEGYADESVFALMLLSHHRGIKGCRDFIEDSNSYYDDDYVKQITEYKYYLEEQSLKSEWI